jgi:hypothetical protein
VRSWIVVLFCIAGCEAVHPEAARPVEPLDGVRVEPTAAAPPAPTIASPPARKWNEPAARAHVEARVADWMEHTPRVGNNVACAMTCHTAAPYAFMLGRDSGPSAIRDTLEKRVDERVLSVAVWKAGTPFYGSAHSITGDASLSTEGVLNAATAAAIDRANGRALGPTTRAAFERMWEMQREDGGFSWLDFDLEPYENGSEIFGAAVAVRAVANLSPEEAKNWPVNIRKLVTFVRANAFKPKVSLFARANVLAASAELPGLVDPATRMELALEIANAGNMDGGYSWVAMGIPLVATDSDSLPTAMAILAMRAAPADVPGERLAKIQWAEGLAADWLVAHQAVDGSFPSISPNKNVPRSNLVMTDAATAYAVMALSRGVAVNDAR